MDGVIYSFSFVHCLVLLSLHSLLLGAHGKIFANFFLHSNITFWYVVYIVHVYSSLLLTLFIDFWFCSVCFKEGDV